MDAPELFSGEHEVREKATRAGWSTSVGNGWAAVFVSPDDGGSLTLRAYASFFEASVRPAFLVVETLEGRGPLSRSASISTDTVPESEESGSEQ